MSRCMRPRQEWGRGQNTKMGGRRLHRAAKSRPGPCGLRGSLPPQAAQEIAARVLAARRGSSNGVVRQHVVQTRKGGIRRKHGNHQSTTQTTQVSDDPGTSRGEIGRASCREKEKGEEGGWE